MLPNEEIAVRKLYKILTKKFNILDFVIFGSKVKTNSEESDIDIMIKLEEYDPHIISQIDDVVFEINLEYDCLITTVIFSRKELEEGPLGDSPLYKVILKEGIRL